MDTYQTLLNQASVISNDNSARYNAYAKAQALLIDSALQIPMVAIGGVPRVSKGVPFSGSFSWAGNKGGSWYKRLKLQAQPITTEQYEKAYQAWQSEKSASNAKYADSLVNRVKNQIQQQAMLQQLMLQPRIRQQRIDLINQQSIKSMVIHAFYLGSKKIILGCSFEQSFVLWVGDDCNTDLIVVLGIDIVCSHGITTKAKN